MDRGLAKKIAEIGFRPFLMVRFGGGRGANPNYLVCKTQEELSQFVEALADYSGLAQCGLLHGLERALRSETYEAADYWFSWARAASNEAGETVYAYAEDGPNYDYPIYEVAPGTAADGGERRLGILVELFNAYSGTDGNNTTRYLLAEALAFALSRCLGARGQHREAAAIVERALDFNPKSIYLKAARIALKHKLDGTTVPDRLVKFIGEDNGYLRQWVCPLPFEHFEIGPSGDVRVCCGHWVPTTIGNFLKSSVEDVLNSAQAQKMRESMVDGSYKYCNHLDCVHMIRGTLPKVDELQLAVRKAVRDVDYCMEGIRYLTFGLDQTCNLSCPSCRSQRIVEKASDSIEKVRAVEEKLLGVLPSVNVLHINPAGELFSSKPSRKLLSLIDDKYCPNLQLDIICNGTLLTEEEWNKFPGIHNKVRSIRISVDAACKQTFEKLRRLGRWEPFIENMRFLARLRAERLIPMLNFSFTYQLDNFREMPAFVEFCASMNCDFAIFERLQNIVFSWDEFRRKAVHYPDHPLHAEFLKVVTNPVFASPRVGHDFDYEEAARLSSQDVLFSF